MKMIEIRKAMDKLTKLDQQYSPTNRIVSNNPTKVRTVHDDLRFDLHTNMGNGCL
jgi:hypothetical protein